MDMSPVLFIFFVLILIYFIILLTPIILLFSSPFFSVDEQEYTLFNLDEVTPLGWPTGGYPKPQGKYVCAYVLVLDFMYTCVCICVCIGYMCVCT